MTDPMLDGIDRWTYNSDGWFSHYSKVDDGPMVKFSDVSGLIARVVEREQDKWQSVVLGQYEQGRRDTLDAAREAVAAAELRVLHAKADALAAIDGVVKP